MNALRFILLILCCSPLIQCESNILENFEDGQLNVFRFGQTSDLPEIKKCAETGFYLPDSIDGYCAVTKSNSNFETSFLWFQNDFQLEIEYYYEKIDKNVKAQILFIKEDNGKEMIINTENFSSTDKKWNNVGFKQHVNTKGYFKIRILVDSMRKEDFFAINNILITPEIESYTGYASVSGVVGVAKTVVVLAIIQFLLIVLIFVDVAILTISLNCKIRFAENRLVKKMEQIFTSSAVVGVTQIQSPELKLNSEQQNQMPGPRFSMAPPTQTDSRFKPPPPIEPRFKPPFQPEPGFNTSPGYNAQPQSNYGNGQLPRFK